MDKTKSRKCKVGSKAAKAVTVPVNKKGSAAPAPKRRRNEAAVPMEWRWRTLLPWGRRRIRSS